jgi:hypothetical protein
MSNPNPTRSTVRRTLIRKLKVPDALSILNTACSAGGACPQVQGSPLATEALGELKEAVSVATAFLTTKQKADQDGRAAGKALKKQLRTVRTALFTYETAVNGVADGDAAVITKAGLPSRDESPAPKALEMVNKLSSSLGPNPKQARISWAEAPGATGYAVEVNFAPQASPPGWVSLGTCSRHTKMVTAPAPGAQFLVRIAAIASDGTLSDWCDPILATAR